MICELFFVLITVSIAASLANHNYETSGQLQDNTNMKNSFYGCGMYSKEIHCDPLHNGLGSYEVNSTSSVVHSVTNTPIFVNGKQGKALEMYANHAESVAFSNTSAINPKTFTISFWIKGVQEDPKTEFPTFGHVVSTGGWSFNNYNTSSDTNEYLQFTVLNDAGEPFSPPNIDVTSLTFVHIAVTFDGTFVKIYKDGSFFGQIKFNGTYGNYAAVPLRISGAAESPMSFFWSGIMDDLRFYDKPLSGNEIQRIFANDSTAIVASKNLVGHWPFDDNLDDISGNSHHGVQNTLVSSMVFSPDGRLFFAEKNTGRIRIMNDDKLVTKPFASISDYYVNWEQGLLGLATDPKFEQNHYVYLYYTAIDNKTSDPYNRLVRFTDENGTGKNMTILLDKIGPTSRGFHSGGALAFGPDEKLYITVGDATQNVKCGDLPDSLGLTCSAQDPKSLLGKVLRINRDGTIPLDNPYPNSPVYNLGHINMFGIAFDNHGFGLVSENGDVLYDEINTVEKAANYGAPTLQPFNSPPENSSNSSVKPLRSYYIARCLTQMIYFNGNKIPELKEKFLVGSLDGDIFDGHIYALRVDKDSKQIIEEEKIRLRNFPYNEAVSLAQSPNGDLYYGGYAISKLEKVDFNDKKEILFPVELNYSFPALRIKNLQILPSRNAIVIDLSTNIHNSTGNFSNYNAFLSVKIPNALLNGISTVSINSSEFQTEEAQNSTITNYTIDKVSSHDSNIINISFSLRKDSETKLFIGSPSKSEVNKMTRNTPKDTTIPIVKIVNPHYPLTIRTNKTVIINGSASDSTSGIQKVEAFVHSFPFKQQWPYELIKDTTRSNWSKWSFPVHINSSGSYRISVKATDNAGNENWAETIINVPFVETDSIKGSQNKIAFVDNTFTRSAYSEHGFYDFYFKYGFPPFGIKITSDLDMLTAKIQAFAINETNSARMSNLTALIPQDTDESRFWLPFIEHIQTDPKAIVTVLRDQDVHDGHIFKSDGSNAYDTIILFHDEYVTQKEYDNFRNFVRNGGTIVFLDGNVFYAEVQYNEDKQTITLVKGHDWEYDGKSAKRSMGERWYNETKQWVGSNFIVTDISTKIWFENNPFNYTHFEENFVNNPNVHIIRDYKVKFPADYLATGNKFPPGQTEGNIAVATYDLNYGKGKVIMFGLYGQRLANNETFLNFYDDLVAQYSLKMKK